MKKHLRVFKRLYMEYTVCLVAMITLSTMVIIILFFGCHKSNSAVRAKIVTSCTDFVNFDKRLSFQSGLFLEMS